MSNALSLLHRLVEIDRRGGQRLDDANPECRNGVSTTMDRQRANVGMNRQ